MDVTPAIPAGRQVVESYGAGHFRVSGQVYRGSILVFPQRTSPWPIGRIDQLTPDSLAPVVATADELDILLLGCGARLAPIPDEVRRALRAHGVVIEAMDTGAACRTYNVLLAEARRVAAALIAVE